MYGKSHYSKYFKVLSILLVVFILFTAQVYADEIQPMAELQSGTTACYIKNFDTSKVIEPVTLSYGANVRTSDKSFDETELWYIQNLYNGYYTIRFGSYNNTSFYLHTVSTADGSYVQVGNNSGDIIQFSDNYQWKITKVGSGAFLDMYTIVSKADETKYLVVTNGYVSLATGAGSGRAQSTRYWEFHDNDQPIVNLKTTYAGNAGDSDLRPICLASIYDEIPTYGTNCYFGAYINGTVTDVIQSCKNIGASEIREYDGFNARGLIDIIQESSVCVITTHGSPEGVFCVSSEDNVSDSLTSDYIDENIPDHYFSGTECVLLQSCSTAGESGEGSEEESEVASPDSFAYILQQKGIGAVVAFKQETKYVRDSVTGIVYPDYGGELYNQYFLWALGQGQTVSQAAGYAADRIGEGWGVESYTVSGNGNITFNDLLS